jgi:hypothetical protein
MSSLEAEVAAASPPVEFLLSQEHGFAVRARERMPRCGHPTFFKADIMTAWFGK